MSILYRGRTMPCHNWRTGNTDCTRYSEYRVEADHAFLHLCAACAEPFRADAAWTLIPLAPEGELDELPAMSFDDDALLVGSPWVVSVNGRTRDDVLRERDAHKDAQ